MRPGDTSTRTEAMQSSLVGRYGLDTWLGLGQTRPIRTVILEGRSVGYV